MWEATATLMDGSVIRAFALPDGTVHIYEDEGEYPSETLVPDEQSPTGFSPESLATTLRFWCYEFRRGEQLETVQIRFLRGA